MRFDVFKAILCKVKQSNNVANAITTIEPSVEVFLKEEDYLDAHMRA